MYLFREPQSQEEEEIRSAALSMLEGFLPVLGVNRTLSSFSTGIWLIAALMIRELEDATEESEKLALALEGLADMIRSESIKKMGKLQ